MVEANKTYVGIVEDNNDPKKLGRVRIRVLDVFDELEVENIPWASPWKDLNGNEFNVPEKGKVLLVIFDSGDQYKPEFISADHYNVNLEKKLTSLSESDYISMKSLIFDHKTQIYVNDSEGLKIDHKYNNLNIKESSINLNLKDNNASLNLGDATAGQQAILGNHWMDWFDEFVDNLMGSNGGPYLGNMGAPVVTNPAMIQVLMKYKSLRDPVFLSHHVNIVDNDKVSTVKNTEREDTPQVGDAWSSTKTDNNLTKKTSEDFKPVDGQKPEYNDSVVPPKPEIPNEGANITTPIIGSDTNQINTNPPNELLSSTTSNPKIDKLIKFLNSKGYKTYDGIGILNIVTLQSNKKDDGEVSNKFDDNMILFFKNNNGNWDLLEYQITSMPGLLPKTTTLPDNIGMLALGQYIDQCTIGTYIKNHNLPIKHSKCIKISECVIHINDNINKYNYKSNKISAKDITIIHGSVDTGSAEFVYNYSGGSHVFKNSEQYNQFIELCEKQVTLSSKNTFTYTVCRNSEFENFN